MTDQQAYPIGITGKKWGTAEKALWLKGQIVKRSYRHEVLAKLETLKSAFEVEQYGALSISPDQSPLYLFKPRQWKDDKPNILVTGGVHGYETSGVHGAIRFLESQQHDDSAQFNLIVAPCVSPWAYETINRWNPFAVDPNRSFYANSPSEEAALLRDCIHTLGIDFLAHFDLHETTDTDNSEFRPALSARDAIEHKTWHIPDGFYTVDDIEKSKPEFQAAIIRSVAQVTHIAPPDPDGKLIGETLQQQGVIHYSARQLGLCMAMTHAQYVTTTEVYPDSPKVDDENCIDAQVAAITGGLDYLALVG